MCCVETWLQKHLKDLSIGTTTGKRGGILGGKKWVVAACAKLRANFIRAMNHC